MIYKFPLISGMDEIFIGRFLLIINIFSQTLIQTVRYSIGSFFESREFQLLSGIQVSYEEIYWSIFPICALVVFFSAQVSIMMKRLFEKYKEYKSQTGSIFDRNLIEQVLNNTISLHVESNAIAIPPPTMELNTLKHNPTLTSLKQLLGFGLVFFIMCIVNFVIMDHRDTFEKFKPYENWLFTKLFIEHFILRIAWAVLYICRNEQFCQFVRNFEI